jgi:hypothetical protein
MTPTTKVLIPVLSAAVLVGAPALAASAKAPAARTAATSCPFKAGYDPLREDITPHSRYIQLKPNRVDTVSDTSNDVTTSYRWTWKPLNGAKICEFSYTQNGVLRHAKIVRNPNGGSWTVRFTWHRGIGKERVFVTARL